MYSIHGDGPPETRRIIKTSSLELFHYQEEKDKDDSSQDPPPLFRQLPLIRFFYHWLDLNECKVSH